MISTEISLDTTEWLHPLVVHFGLSVDKVWWDYSKHTPVLFLLPKCLHLYNKQCKSQVNDQILTYDNFCQIEKTKFYRIFNTLEISWI